MLLKRVLMSPLSHHPKLQGKSNLDIYFPPPPLIDSILGKNYILKRVLTNAYYKEKAAKNKAGKKKTTKKKQDLLFKPDIFIKHRFLSLRTNFTLC